MSLRIRYMGAKHGLARVVASAIANLPSGPCLDAFSGMCSVAGALAPSSREIWCNDVQEYAALVARTMVASSGRLRSRRLLIRSIKPFFRSNLAALSGRFSDALGAEEKALRYLTNNAFLESADSWRCSTNDTLLSTEVALLHDRRLDPFPFRLATLLFSHGYFGLCQSLELDSIRYGIDRAVAEFNINQDERDLLMLALLQTASQISTSPGHFAQYLSPQRLDTYMRIRRLRRISPWKRFAIELQTIRSYGERNWRSRNRIFCGEAILLLQALAAEGRAPSIVYADPPYSRAQYSRYYHVLETLLLYDYPSASGKGRYRPGRFQTPFSHAGKVVDAFHSLVGSAARLSASFVLSYPTDGLLFAVGADPLDIVSGYYHTVEAYSEIRRHSTLGGAPGRESSPVQELIIVARQPRT